MCIIVSQYLIWNSSACLSKLPTFMSRHIKEKLICADCETWKRSKWICWRLVASCGKHCLHWKGQLSFSLTSATCSGTDTSSKHWDEMSLICLRHVITRDGGLNQLPPWDSLCSQQWVMSAPRALKLTLIIAPKTITKQQELADVSGGRMVMVDEVTLT